MPHNKKRLIILVSIILLVGCLFGIQRIIRLDNFKKYQFDEMGLSLDKGIKIIENVDTHDNFLGDGETYTVYRLTEEQLKVVKNDIVKSKYWSKMNKGQTIYIDDSKMKNKIPQNLNEGYIFLYSGNIKEDAKVELKKMKVEEISLTNYSYALLDTVNKKLYFYRWDS